MIPAQRISSANRIYLCPGSVKSCQPIDGLQFEQPNVPTAASSGTKVHNAIHTLLAGASIDDMNLTGREEWIANNFAKVCREEEAKIGTPTRILPETEAFIGQMFSAHWDRVVVFDGVAMLHEFKTGRAHQDAADSHIQGRFYVVAAMESLQLPPDIHVHLHVQSAGEEVGEWHSMCVFTAADIKNARKEAEIVFGRADEPNAPRVPGQVQCRYCRAKGTPYCPETHQMLQQAAAGLPKNPDPKEVNAMDGALDLWKQVKPFGDNVENVARAMMESGMEFPHFEFGKPRISREVTDITECHNRVQGIVPEPAFLEACSVSLPELENAAYLGQAKGEGIKKQTRENIKVLMEETLAGIVEKKPSRKLIVRRGEDE